MAHHLAATISELPAAKLNPLRAVLGEADAVEFALRTADLQACRAAFAASLLGCGGPAPSGSVGELVGVVPRVGARTPSPPREVEELVGRLAEAMAARAGEEPSAALVPVVVALAEGLLARRGQREGLASVATHTLTGALVELYRSRSAAAVEDR